MTAEQKLEWSDVLLNGEAVTFVRAEKAVRAKGPGWRLPTEDELFGFMGETGLLLDSREFWASPPHDPHARACVRAVRQDFSLSDDEIRAIAANLETCPVKPSWLVGGAAVRFALEDKKP